MVPTSPPDLPKPSRSPGKSQKLEFYNPKCQRTNRENILIFPMNSFWGGPIRGDLLVILESSARLVGKIRPAVVENELHGADFLSRLATIRGQNREQLRKHRGNYCFITCPNVLSVVMGFFSDLPWVFVWEGCPRIPSKYRSNPPKSFPSGFPLF